MQAVPLNVQLDGRIGEPLPWKKIVVLAPLGSAPPLTTIVYPYRRQSCGHSAVSFRGG